MTARKQSNCLTNDVGVLCLLNDISFQYYHYYIVDVVGKFWWVIEVQYKK